MITQHLILIHEPYCNHVVYSKEADTVHIAICTRRQIIYISCTIPFKQSLELW